MKTNRALTCQHVIIRHDDDKSVVAKRHHCEFPGVHESDDDAEVSTAFVDRAHGFRTGVFLDIDIDLGVVREESREQRGKEFVDGMGIGKQPDVASHAFAELRQIVT